jgi:hypothetical protein
MATRSPGRTVRDTPSTAQVRPKARAAPASSTMGGSAAPGERSRSVGGAGWSAAAITMRDVTRVGLG